MDVSRGPAGQERVAGGILAVLPGQLGIGVFSPRLDARGNSRRGVAVCTDLSQELGMHCLRVTRSSQSALRGERTLAAVRSKRRRSSAEVAHLDAAGEQASVYELQGDLAFAGVEALVRRIVGRPKAAQAAIVDLRRVTRIDEPATRVVLELATEMSARDRPLLFAGIQNHPAFARALEEHGARLEPGGTLRGFTDLDAALEWAEERLLRAGRDTSAATGAVPLADHEICRGLDPAALAQLERELERKQFARGEFIVRAGDTARTMYLLLAGHVSVVLTLPNGQLKRLATLPPGTVFGELALVSRLVRSADVRADEPTECYVLSAERFEHLDRVHPSITSTLLQNMLRQAHDTVSRLNRELAALDG
jgi:glutaminase